MFSAHCDHKLWSAPRPTPLSISPRVSPCLHIKSMPTEPRRLHGRRRDSGFRSYTCRPTMSSTVRSIVPIARRTRLAIGTIEDRKSTRLNSSHSQISYAVFCLKKKKVHTPVHETVDLMLLSLVLHASCV